ncbi:MAG: secondary thiamine-phosphate synthase enzyme YjbQ [Brevinematales bacterium]|nr:secondary thiamine-phosphate synthase enzyme YjbQ [Brevinematales bacterium]
MEQSLMIRRNLSTPSRECMVALDALIQEIIATSGVKEGICTIFVPHTTAALTINENADPDVQRDILSHLRTIIPKRGDFHHSEGNSDAHIKSILVGPSLSLIISEGKAHLGTWQSVFLCEFDGPRTREVWFQIVPC